MQSFCFLVSLFAAGSLVAVGCSPSDRSRPAPSADTTNALSAITLRQLGTNPPGHWIPYRLDNNGRTIDLYIAHDSELKPVLLWVHGSGCAPLVTIDPNGTIHDTTLIQDLVAPNLQTLHVAIVDRRGVKPLRFSEGMDYEQKLHAYQQAERECTPEYLRQVTKPSRVEDILATIAAVKRQPWAEQILLAGHSEGTHVVTGTLRATHGQDITAAGLFASAGPIPFYGGYVARGAGDRDRFQAIFDQVRTVQRLDDDSMYNGLPGRRWKTFWLDSTPIEDVRDSTTPIFVAQGSSDGTSLPADLFALEAIRQQPARPLRYIVVEKGDHAFQTPDGKAQIGFLLDDFLRWGLDEHRETGVSVVK